MKRLVNCFRDGRISAPFLRAGEGEVPKTFLAPDMVPRGTELSRAAC
jgi:hypothetical protein